MLVLYQTQKAPPRFHGAGSFVKLGGRTDDCQSPAMQLHSGGWWSLAKVYILPKSALSHPHLPSPKPETVHNHLTQSATRRVLQTDRREHYSGKVRSGLSSSSILTSLYVITRT